MTLEDDDDGHFFDAAGNEVHADAGRRRGSGGVLPPQRGGNGGVIPPRSTPHPSETPTRGHRTERPAREEDTEDFVRGVDLDG